MKYILIQVSMYLLVFNTVYLGRRIQDEVRHIRVKTAKASLVAHDSSLIGIDSKGAQITPSRDSNGQLRGKGFVLLFAFHHKDGRSEMDFWNRVIDGTSGRLGVPIQYWGVCDEGSTCDSYQSAARFHIVGYLDPYQMHLVDEANSGQYALLYDATMTLKARVSKSVEPRVESEHIVEKMK